MAKPSTGPRGAAELLAGLDDATRERILGEIKEQDPKLASAIEDLMFLFEDLLRIDAASLQPFLINLDRTLLATALRKSSHELKMHLLSALPSRSRTEIEELIVTIGAKKESDVYAAQKKISELIHQLNQKK
ncbi:MAG: hypothetical protein KA715_14795 [Xanthomonadaceae bacterium]|nr:hypothetical protein [Xanthomonadaceae bacterium]